PVSCARLGLRRLPVRVGKRACCVSSQIRHRDRHESETKVLPREVFMNLQPLGDRLIVEVLDEEEETVSGIVLPDTAKEKPQRGRVLAVGPGAGDGDGKPIKMD